MVLPPKKLGIQSSSNGGGHLAFAAVDRRVTDHYEGLARGKGLPAQTYRVEPVGRVGTFRAAHETKHDFTQVTSPDGFRVVGPAGPSRAPVAREQPFRGNREQMADTRRRLLANPNDAQAREIANLYTGRKKYTSHSGNDDLV